jgi:hypothetical protein
MFKIVGTPPVKTRLPFAAWFLAGLVELFSLVTSQVSSPIVQAAKPATANYASMTDLLNLFGALAETPIERSISSLWQSVCNPV